MVDCTIYLRFQSGGEKQKLFVYLCCTQNYSATQTRYRSEKRQPCLNAFPSDLFIGLDMKIPFMPSLSPWVFNVWFYPGLSWCFLGSFFKLAGKITRRHIAAVTNSSSFFFYHIKKITVYLLFICLFLLSICLTFTLSVTFAHL